MRAFDLACRALGDERIHSSSRVICFWRLSSAAFSLSARLAFCSSQLE